MLDVQNPIYSAETECQDCYKCIRQCPVKAIRVENNHAAIVPDLCIACGHCVDICPSGAKRVRDDLSLAQQVVRNSSRVIASLAPSFISEFPDVTPSQMIQALKALGFFGVSETALGAQQVSAHLGTLLDTVEHQLVLSSACPVAVEYVLRYLPAHAEYITRLYSPLLAHCAYIKNIYGEATDVVFIGPCIAKKFDAQ
ncbi:MAG TPA: [Fe-Fe] hydrogenase large subunit C-terminal domain-containing protein, partial [Armatimonadota bacterium]|nr:[Fe-Fe] hydrogenase large subunit C-terminal domain-containing protein [Armatimonadota bacterium]